MKQTTVTAIYLKRTGLRQHIRTCTQSGFNHKNIKESTICFDSPVLQVLYQLQQTHYQEHNHYDSK